MSKKLTKAQENIMTALGRKGKDGTILPRGTGIRAAQTLMDSGYLMQSGRDYVNGEYRLTDAGIDYLRQHGHIEPPAAPAEAGQETDTKRTDGEWVLTDHDHETDHHFHTRRDAETHLNANVSDSASWTLQLTTSQQPASEPTATAGESDLANYDPRNNVTGLQHEWIMSANGLPEDYEGWLEKRVGEEEERRMETERQLAAAQAERDALIVERDATRDQLEKMTTAFDFALNSYNEVCEALKLWGSGDYVAREVKKREAERDALLNAMKPFIRDYRVLSRVYGYYQNGKWPPQEGSLLTFADWEALDKAFSDVYKQPAKEG